MDEKLHEDKDDLFYHCLEIQVDPGQSPVRLDRFLFARLERISRNKIQAAIRSESVTVDHHAVKPNYRIKPGEVIRALVPKVSRDEQPVVPQEIPLDIIFEDDWLLVLNKPPGMVVHPGVGNHDHTLVNALAYYLQLDQLPLKSGNTQDRAGLVHRIDKDTSGLLVVAKDDFTMSHLARQFFDHTIDRQYLALVWGQPEPSQGTIEGHIGRHSRFRLQMDVFPEAERGKHAVTHYEVVEGYYYVSLVKCTLQTGRTHQIRVHMKYLGHPVFNDARYGGNRILKGTVHSKYKQFVENCFKILPRQALHAYSLGFTHPVKNKRIFFETPLPADFEEVVSRWRQYVASRSDRL